MSSRSILAGLSVLALLVAAICPRWASAADEELWTTSFEDAKAAAAKDGKDILMEFTGSDWCPPCIKLHDNVLTKDVFKTETPKSFVLLKLDSPRDKSKQSEEEQAQYKKLSAQYKVSGVPTIILVDATGKPYAKKVGYGGTPADEYVKDLTERTKIRTQRDEYLAKAEKAKGVEKAKLLDKALDRIDSALTISVYEKAAKQIIELDADNGAGLKDKYEGKFKLPGVRTTLRQLQRSLDAKAPEATLAKIQKLIEDEDLKGEALQEALYTKGYIQYQVKDRDAAKATLEAALKLAPDTEKGKQIEQILKSAFKQ